MSYVINNSRGQVLAVVPVGTVNTTATSLTLVGQGVTNYGTAENENYVYLLENFANSSAPLTPIAGQLWYNTDTGVLSVYQVGGTWSAMSSQAYVDAQKDSPAFTGVPTAPTADAADDTTQLATTAFVQAQKDSPAFTGLPTAPTPANTVSTTQIATTAFVQAQKVNTALTGVPTAPTAANATNTTQIATTAFVQAQKDSIVLTGIPVAPTAASSTNTTQIATTAFVQAQKVNTALTGVPTAPTAAGITNTTQIATTAFVQAQKNNTVLTGTPVAPTASSSDSSTQIATTAFVQAQKASPSFSGAPTAPTAAPGTANTQIASTAFVSSAVSAATASLGSMSTQNAGSVAITGGSITGIADISVADGGTGASTASGARTNLGLGSMAVQNSSNVAITGGTITGIQGLVPSGAILLWSGSSLAIPTGWYLCNGLNGTPDLTNRFVLGAGDYYAVGATGGSTDAVVVSHTHVVQGNTNVAGSHNHSTQWTFYDGGAGRGLIDPVNPGTGSYYIPTTFAGEHSHTITVSASTTGESGSNKNMPPYYALCYIMKS